MKALDCTRATFNMQSRCQMSSSTDVEFNGTYEAMIL